jgi:DNA-binding transcriptional LysR family regulator
MINLRELEAFRALMLAGSVTGAAQMLRVTQPTISKFVAQLERRSKVRLFDRNRGRLAPRSEARRLLAQVEKVFSAVEEVERSATQLSRGDVGRIRIVSIPPIAFGLLPAAAAAFGRCRPDVQISIDIRGSSHIGEWLTTDQADLGFVSGRPKFNGFVTECVYRSNAVCVLGKGHPLAGRKALSAKELAGENFIALGRDTAFQHMIDYAFDDAGVAPTIVLRTGYSAVACALAARGAGAAVVDPISAFNRWECGDATLRRFEPIIEYESSAVAPQRTLKSDLIREFVACVETAGHDLDARVASALKSRQFRPPRAHSPRSGA